MEDDDVIIFCSAMLILASAVDMLINENAKKSRNWKTSMKDWLHERDTTGIYANILQELRLNDQEISGNVCVWI